ncbi:MAG: hypothetical protein FJX74_09005 [Armatimonadetes bacterium]|nr:hypothetical protein [Armatimonadota bacterium]
MPRLIAGALLVASIVARAAVAQVDPATAPETVAGGAYNFVSEDPDKVIAKALDGSELTQKDADIVGGILAWSFGTQLTEAQKGVVWASTVAFWQAADAQAVQQFSQGFRQMPLIIPQLNEQQRSQIQAASAGIFLQMAQMAPNDPLAQVILTVAQSAAQVLAGDGTQYQLTRQDVDALLEYLCFQNQMMTGVQVVVTAEQYAQFTDQIVEHFNAASDEEKAQLSTFDLLWGQLRSAWAIAQATQQQALIDQQIQQWQQAYQQAGIYNPGAGGWANAAPVGGWGGGGGEMDQSTFDTLSNVLRMEHETSMGIINNIGDGPTTSVYDSSGNWLYDY